MFGPEDSFFNRFAAMARISPALPLIGGGATRFQPVFVGDVAEAVGRAVDGTAKAGAIYELGGPEVFSFKELMQITLDQVRMLRFDNVVSEEAKSENRTLEGLGINPTALEVVLPTYLTRFRERGQFTQPRTAA